MPARRRLRPIVTALLTASVAVAAPPPTGAALQVGQWTTVATHPEAAQQPTVTGRTLDDLAVVGVDLYAGFGDYGNNTGPIAIDPFDLSAGAFEGVRGEAPTHQIGVWRTWTGGLIAPDIDPLGDGTAKLDPQAGLETYGPGGSWSHATIAPAYHVFDVAQDGAGDLWAAGSGSTAQGAAAVAWRSSDGGHTWSRARVDNDTTTATDRYYWVAAVGGAVYFQASYPGAPLRRYAGGTASELQPGGTGELCDTGRPNRVVVFRDQIVCGDQQGIHTYDPVSGALSTAHIDGTQARDFFVSSTTVYVLTGAGIYASTDGRTWAQVQTPPTGAASLAVVGNTIYVGNDAAQILAATTTG